MEPIFHLLVPMLLLLAIFPKINRRLVLALAPLAVIMDFDTIFSGYHRMIFHNIFFLVIVTLIIYFALGKLAGLISLYYLASHIIFDMAYWGVAFFYPVYQKFIFVTAKILEVNKTLVYNFSISTTQVTTQQLAISQHDIFSEVGLMIILLLGILLISKMIKR